ncbi:hypothetical protein CEXT_609271 [Caerostris extrusa]|uniref:Uncharacterized protein n=1 Tax=Caerostris extrusa TaxID=172846 RepID=A0AAV4SPF8_CAEEX|nr:hypothetical protein CEXT_609271 [Caerostris extrusa]
MEHSVAFETFGTEKLLLEQGVSGGFHTSQLMVWCSVLFWLLRLKHLSAERLQTLWWSRSVRRFHWPFCLHISLRCFSSLARVEE